MLHLKSKISTKYLAALNIQAYNVSMKAKLIAYLSLCRPIPEYEDTLRETTKASVRKLGMSETKPLGLLLT